MENKIQTFKNKEFGEIRVALDERQEPLFCAKDVAKALGYVDTADAISRHCKSGKKVFHPHANAIGGVNVIYISESDLYRLAMRSNAKNAERFQDWVCEEVLPTIRRHGAYMTPDTLEKIQENPDIIIQLATALKREREKYRTSLQQLQQELQEEKDYSFKTAFDLFMQTEKTFNAKKEIREYREKAKGYLFIADGLKHLLKENNIRIPGNLLLYREDYEFLNEKDPDMEAFMKRRKKAKKITNK